MAQRNKTQAHFPSLSGSQATGDSESWHYNHPAITSGAGHGFQMPYNGLVKGHARESQQGEGRSRTRASRARQPQPGLHQQWKPWEPARSPDRFRPGGLLLLRRAVDDSSADHKQPSAVGQGQRAAAVTCPMHLGPNTDTQRRGAGVGAIKGQVQLLKSNRNSPLIERAEQETW